MRRGADEPNPPSGTPVSHALPPGRRLVGASLTAAGLLLLGAATAAFLMGSSASRCESNARALSQKLASQLRRRQESAVRSLARRISQLEPRPEEVVDALLAEEARRLPWLDRLVVADGAGKILACWDNRRPPGSSGCPVLHVLPAPLWSQARRGRVSSGYLLDAGRPVTLVTTAPVLDRPDGPSGRPRVAGYVGAEARLDRVLSVFRDTGLEVWDQGCRLSPPGPCPEGTLAGPWHVRWARTTPRWLGRPAATWSLFGILLAGGLCVGVLGILVLRGRRTWPSRTERPGGRAPREDAGEDPGGGEGGGHPNDSPAGAALADRHVAGDAPGPDEEV